MKRFTLVLAGCFLFVQLQAQHFEESADSLRRYRSIPGMVYAVFTSDSILEKGAGGYLKMGTRRPVLWSNRFSIGLNTTAFTSYIAARMVAENKISWNTKIVEAIPELSGKIMKLYERITLRQLFENRLALPPFMDQSDLRLVHTLPGTGTEQRLQFATLILKRRPPVILDSSKVTYSIAGPSIAALMLEKRSKRSWEKLVDEYISTPLNIHIGYGFPSKSDSTQPIGHWNIYGYLTAEPNNYWAQYFPALAPSGSISLSADDFIPFVQDHLRALNGEPSKLGPIVNTLLFGKPDYSIGWYNSTWNGMQIAYGIGKGWVYSSYVEIIREKNIGIVVLCNDGASDGLAGAVNFGRMLREYYAQ